MGDSRIGPLVGLRVVEFAGIGPGPFACMLLSDMGADVVTIQREEPKGDPAANVVGRGRTVVLADLKHDGSRARVEQLLDRADVLVEGFRPGVMERLGLGPEDVSARNPRLVYARMTGWGQTGPLANTAGHDINYIAITGALHAIGTQEGGPVPPLNLVGDYGGGSLYLIVGILAALHAVRASGRGQVVDAAICDGALSMMSAFVGWARRGMFHDQRGTMILDGSAPWYTTYETLDGRYMAVGAIEPQFFATFCEMANLPQELRDAQQDRSRWPRMRSEFARIFRTRTRDDWAARFDGSDACVSPVLTLGEASSHPHHVARKSFVPIGDIMLPAPAPAPRFSRTPASIQGLAPTAAVPLADVLRNWT